MQNIATKRELAKIRLDFQEATKMRQRIASKKNHGIVMMERSTLSQWFDKAFRVIGSFFGRLFAKKWNYEPYVYTGPYKAPTPKVLRFEVYMRRRGRKYKKAM